VTYFRCQAARCSAEDRLKSTYMMVSAIRTAVEPAGSDVDPNATTRRRSLMWRLAGLGGRPAAVIRLAVACRWPPTMPPHPSGNLGSALIETLPTPALTRLSDRFRLARVFAGIADCCPLLARPKISNVSLIVRQRIHAPGHK
jgi:hypothetical protein